MADEEEEEEEKRLVDLRRSSLMASPQVKMILPFFSSTTLDGGLCQYVPNFSCKCKWRDATDVQI